MHCLRCQGLMLKDYFLDMEGGFGEMWARSWRCLSCGAVRDAVIEKNRLGEPITLEDQIYLGGEAFIRPAA